MNIGDKRLLLYITRSLNQHGQRKIGPGIRHRCGFAARKRNLIKMALDGRPASEQITSAMLKVLVSGKGAKQGEPMRLKQLKGGNLLKVCVGQQKEKKGVQVKVIYFNFR